MPLIFNSILPQDIFRMKSFMRIFFACIRARFQKTISTPTDFFIKFESDMINCYNSGCIALNYLTLNENAFKRSLVELNEKRNFVTSNFFIANIKFSYSLQKEKTFVIFLLYIGPNTRLILRFCFVKILKYQLGHHQKTFLEMQKARDSQQKTTNFSFHN